MKILLTLSVVLNVILGVLYFREVNQPPLERIVLEKSAPEVITRKIVVEKRVRVRAKPEAQAISPMDPEHLAKIEETVERVGRDKTAFLTEQLQLEPHQLEAIERTKEKFYNKFAAANHDQRMHPTLEQRRKLLELEVELEASIEKLLGKDKWKKFKTFRDQYNKQTSDDAGQFSMSIPMGI